MGIARVLGIKLILLAVSFAAVGQTVTPGATFAEATWGGMKLLHLILGMMGSGVSLFFLPQLNARWLGATVTAGLVLAITGTPVAVWGAGVYFATPLPGPLENLLALAFGFTGVYLLAAGQRMAETFKANPWGVLTWLRGGGVGAPPQAGEPADKGSRP